MCRERDGDLSEGHRGSSGDWGKWVCKLQRPGMVFIGHGHLEEAMQATAKATRVKAGEKRAGGAVMSHMANGSIEGRHYSMTA